MTVNLEFDTWTYWTVGIAVYVLIIILCGRIMWRLMMPDAGTRVASDDLLIPALFISIIWPLVLPVLFIAWGISAGQPLNRKKDDS